MACGKSKEPSWVHLRDEELLDVRMRDLGLKIEGSPIESRVARLYEELERRHIKLRPHVWLAEEWFAADGVPGIAIPFYLAHPRLIKLEQRQMLEVEGGTRDECMRILRHEAGHALDTAYRIRRRKQWREVFGPASKKYPEYYHAKPYSKNYVLHLDSWYAQSHPSEDFAETFAVWLKPDSRWRVTYKGWPALKKLKYVDSLMEELSGMRPMVRSRIHVDPLSQLADTLRDHYRKKRQRYSTAYPDFYDRDLRRLFSEASKPGGESAAAFLRRYRRELREDVSHWTGVYQYTIDQVLADMILRARQLKLRRYRAERRVKQEATVLLTVQTMNFLHSGRHRLVL